MTVAKSQIDIEKLEFEKEKFQKESEFKTKELELREKEIVQNKVKVSPAQVTIIVALLGILGTLVATYIQNDGNQKLEKYKFESNLILKVMTTDSLQRNKQNLKFLVESGLITNNLKIQNVLKDPTSNLKVVENVSPKYSILLHGEVINEAGLPISYALVNVDHSAVRLLTNLNGRFILNYPSIDQSKQHRLSISKKGFQTQITTIFPTDAPIIIVLRHD